MTNIQLEKTNIISKQILLYFVDFFRVTLPMFDRANIYRIPFKEYDKFRIKNKERFRKELYRLKQEGIVKKYTDKKGDFLELTNKGRNRLKQYLSSEIRIPTPQKWDKKWRLVIFDIPSDKAERRDMLRQRLLRLGFIELQESVYVYPFECLEEINLYKYIYSVSSYVQYVVADRIETETNLIKKFNDRGILTEDNIS